MTVSTPRSINAVTGTSVMFTRVLTVYRHSPGLAAVMLAAPLGMMLLFGFVFGGALSGGADASAYRSFLTPGILVLVAAMGLIATASTANADMNSGLTDRLRTLPVRTVAIPSGLALAEALIGIVALAAMAGVGFLSGWRIDATATDILLALLLLIAFRLAFAWLGIVLGLLIRDEQMLQQLAPLIFGAIMLSNVFVPTDTMPSIVGTIAEWNPVSAVVEALRQLFGAASTVSADAAWPMHHPVVAAFGWVALILALSIPAAASRYSSNP